MDASANEEEPPPTLFPEGGGRENYPSAHLAASQNAAAVSCRLPRCNLELLPHSFPARPIGGGGLLTDNTMRERNLQVTEEGRRRRSKFQKVSWPNSCRNCRQNFRCHSLTLLPDFDLSSTPAIVFVNAASCKSRKCFQTDTLRRRSRLCFASPVFVARFLSDRPMGILRLRKLPPPSSAW